LIGLDYYWKVVKPHCLDIEIGYIRVLSCFVINDANRRSRAFNIVISEYNVINFAKSQMQVVMYNYIKRVFLLKHTFYKALIENVHCHH